MKGKDHTHTFHIALKQEQIRILQEIVDSHGLPSLSSAIRMCIFHWEKNEPKRNNDE